MWQKIKQFFKKKSIDQSISIENEIPEEELVMWRFEQLKISLLILSLDVEKQRQANGVGHLTFDISTEFDHFLNVNPSLYLQYNLIDEKLLTELDSLNRFIMAHFDEEDSDFWDDDLIDTNKDWKIVKAKAKEYVKQMSLDDFIIEIEITNDYHTNDKGEKILVQGTRSKLVKRDA